MIKIMNEDEKIQLVNQESFRSASVGNQEEAIIPK